MIASNDSSKDLWIVVDYSFLLSPDVTPSSDAAMNSKLDAILELARRYDYDSGHAHQVECLAGTLFMELQSLHQLERGDRKLLEYAAILHDIGYFVSSKAHHRHALQMIMMEPMPEFSREDKTIIANLARYHRKALPTVDHTAFGILSDVDKQRVGLLAPLLRIADALDKGPSMPRAGTVLRHQRTTRCSCTWARTGTCLKRRRRSPAAPICSGTSTAATCNCAFSARASPWQ